MDDRVLSLVERLHADIREIRTGLLDPSDGVAVRLARVEETTTRLDTKEATNAATMADLLTAYRVFKYFGGVAGTAIVGLIVKAFAG